MSPVNEFTENLYVFFSTRNGIVKKTPLSEYSRPRANGIWAIDLPDDDELVNAYLTDGKQDIILFSSSGKSIRFAENDVRSMGRVARGVIGIRLAEGQKVVSMLVIGDGDILTVTENGYGKRTVVDDHPRQGRGGQGVIGIQTSERNGNLISAIQVSSDDDIMLISDGGTLVRTNADEISTLGRNTQGVTLIRLRQDEKLVGLARIEPEEETGEEEAEEQEGEEHEGEEHEGEEHEGEE